MEKVKEQTDVEKKNNTYKKYINGLKGFACLMIMIGHFFHIFDLSQGEMITDRLLYKLFFDFKLDIIIYKGTWVCLFYIVSGYLLAFSKVDSFKQLLERIFKRFLRLGLPIFFAYSIIYVIYLTIGFHNGETSSLFTNTWLQGYYAGKYTILNVLMGPIDVLILGKCGMNGPYWVLRDMFISSLMIYVISYILGKIKNKTIIGWLLPFVIIAMYLKVPTIIFGCLIGYIVGFCQINIKELLKAHSFAYSMFFIVLLLPLVDEVHLRMLAYCILILLIPKIELLNKLLSGKVFDFIGNISFGIYSFHWPIYCSIGALIILSCVNTMSISVGIILAMVVTTILTFVLSWLFNISFEKFSSFLTKKVSGFIFRYNTNNK